MSFHTVTCVIVECDGCAYDYCGAEDLASHYETWQEAAKDLAGRQEWRIEDQEDGTVTLCPRCAKRHDCDRHGGHHWQPAQMKDGTVTGDLEVCEHCDLQRRICVVADQAAASGHEHDWRYEPAQITPKDIYGPWRVCGCGANSVLLVVPPVLHPEFLEGDLDDEADDYLGWLDALLDEEAADPRHAANALAHLEASKEN